MSDRPASDAANVHPPEPDSGWERAAANDFRGDPGCPSCDYGVIGASCTCVAEPPTDLLAQEIRDAYERELDRWERETGEHRDSCPMDLDEFAAVLDSEGK